MIITYAPKFLRQFKKLELGLKTTAKEKIAVFKENQNISILHTHKLHGDLVNRWAFSINYRYRIVFKYLPTGEINFLAIDDHDIYKR